MMRYVNLTCIGYTLFLIQLKVQFNARRIAGKNIQQLEILKIIN
ncbi:hypothetical protein BAMA111019_04500 [Bacillus manliponensis]